MVPTPLPLDGGSLQRPVEPFLTAQPSPGSEASPTLPTPVSTSRRCCKRRRGPGKAHIVQVTAWPAVPIELGEDLDPEWVARFPLSTVGRNIVDRQGNRFRLHGVNWYGPSDAHHVVGGLRDQSLDVICQTVSRLGFTVVRLPFSNEMLRSQVPEGAIDFERNPSLRGLSPLEVLDEVVRGLGRHRVAVILNNHTTYGTWCGGPDRNGLWFDPTSDMYSEGQWIEDWVMLAQRYLLCPHVIAYDLRNEVRMCPPQRRCSRLRWPVLGANGASKAAGACDWLAATRACADQLLAVNKGALIVVERIVWPQRELRDYAAKLLPSLRGRLVLAVHHYTWSGPGRYLPGFSTPQGWSRTVACLKKWGILTKDLYGDLDRDRLFAQLKKEWGFLLESDTCPVWVSEFGCSLHNEAEMKWLEIFTDFLHSVDADWAYWPLNVGPKPSCGGDEPYGMLAADWTPKPEGDRRLTLLGLGTPP